MKILEKIPNYLVKYAISGFIIFVVILLGIFISNFFAYKFSLPHEKYFVAKCIAYENHSIVYIITKTDIGYIQVWSIENEELGKIENLLEESGYAIKIKKIEKEPILIKYKVEDKEKWTFIECIKEEKKKSILSKILGI